ncbi:MAG TPA: C40 family peptidase [Aquaticitalea sp.]|nr:C40 family peptidase [Aquaticitalea sp.]
MRYGICNLGVVPLKSEPSHTSELVSQVLYGEFFKILEQRKQWSRIRLAYDNYEGWIDNKQIVEISEADYSALSKSIQRFSTDLIEYIQDSDQRLHAIVMGSSLNGVEIMGHTFEGHYTDAVKPKADLLKTAFNYLNAPYMWGGKTPFGIDCSGFTQMVYKINGYNLLRDASQQAQQGTPLSFIEESEPGDLAFFDNEEGRIVHVGIIMENNYIIHSHGKVRIDRLDHSGIYNVDRKIHTHKLRVIKKII